MAKNNEEMKELKEKYENFGFALCGVIVNLYEYLTDDTDENKLIDEKVAKAYCEAVDAMLNEGATSIGYGENRYNMDDLEEISENLKDLF